MRSFVWVGGLDDCRESDHPRLGGLGFQRTSRSIVGGALSGAFAGRPGCFFYYYLRRLEAFLGEFVECNRVLRNCTTRSRIPPQATTNRLRANSPHPLDRKRHLALPPQNRAFSHLAVRS